MTGKLSADEMLRRLDIITERRGQARKRQRDEREAAAPKPRGGRRVVARPASGSSESAAG